MINTVTIIGLGLIGGSLAKALKTKANIEIIYAIDPNIDSINSALSDGVIVDGSNSWFDACSQSQMVFICTSVGEVANWVMQIKDKVSKDCVITDVGSTKEQIISSVDNLEGDFTFIAAHPMAGSEKTGYNASTEELFENVYYIITPSEKSSESGVEILQDIIKSIGSIYILTTPHQHDLVVATISHIPHVLSSVLVNMVESIDNHDFILQFAAGGFRDVTRIASSSPSMWTDISISNRDNIVEMLDLYIKSLKDFKEILYSKDYDKLYQFFDQAKDARDKLPQKAVALSSKTYECVLDIPDRVGIIGEIANILAYAKINIKNIHISNSREFYGGVLIISLSNYESGMHAKDLLAEHGFNVHGE